MRQTQWLLSLFIAVTFLATVNCWKPDGGVKSGKPVLEVTFAGKTKTVTAKEFSSLFDLFLQSLKSQNVSEDEIKMITEDPVKKKEFQDRLLQQLKAEKVLLLKAESENFYKGNKEFDAFLAASIKQQKAQLYQMKALEAILTDIPETTDREIKLYFSTNKARLEQYGIAELNEKNNELLAKGIRNQKAGAKLQEELTSLMEAAQLKTDTDLLLKEDDLSKTEKEKPVLTITLDGKKSTITKEEFDALYTFFTEMGQRKEQIATMKADEKKQLKEQLLKQLKMQELVLMKAEEDGFFKGNKEAENTIAMLVEQQKSQYYQISLLKKVLEKAQTPPEAQVKALYDRQDQLGQRIRQRYPSYDAKAKAELTEYIKTQMAQQELQQDVLTLMEEAGIRTYVENIQGYDMSVEGGDTTVPMSTATNN